MEFEYREPSRLRSRIIIGFGVVLALAAGAAAFVAINQARLQAEDVGTTLVPVVVARREIPARRSIEIDDVELRQLPQGSTTDAGVFVDPAQVVGLVPTVAILAGQPVYANFLTSHTEGGVTILEPGETVAPGSTSWRAVSITVPDDRAVGGLLQPDDVVDVFVTAPITVPDDLAADGRYTSDRSTKITYQNVTILNRVDSFYVVRVDVGVAEEIAHLQAVGSAAFTLALRPIEDARTVDVTRLGETTNAIIERYGLPIPEVYPGTGPLPTAVPSGAPPAEGVTRGIARGAVMGTCGASGTGLSADARACPSMRGPGDRCLGPIDRCLEQPVVRPARRGTRRP